MTRLFIWNDIFITGIDSVDEQHQQLVKLINDLGEMVISPGELDLQLFASVRKGLLAYVCFHFGDEERIMREAGLDPRYTQQHQAAHKAFIDEIQAMDETCNEVSFEVARNLATYLVYWLAYHILDIDQSMARQIKAVRQGQTAAQAYEEDIRFKGSNTEPLVSAMTGLFYLVSERNRELRELNRELDQRVKQRTLELEEANRKLQVLSTQDDLTGLYNRRFAMLSLSQLWIEKERYAGTFSVLLLDADHFKEVNDRYGHAQGDALLRTLAERLRHSVRGSDIVCRIGGDEFLIICPHSTHAAATETAIKILAGSEPFFNADGVECWNGALSIGIAEVNNNMTRPEDILQAADNALYDAKRKGGAGIS